MLLGLKKHRQNNKYETLFRAVDHKERIGYLVNMHASELIQEEDKKLVACVDYYFIQVSFFPNSLPLLHNCCWTTVALTVYGSGSSLEYVAHGSGFRRLLKDLEERLIDRL